MAKGRKTGGRQKNSPNKDNKALREMILAALDTLGGEAYLVQQGREHPAVFLALIGKVLPTTLAGDPSAPLGVIGRVELVPVQPRPFA